MSGGAPGHALVVGGTGMLRGVVLELVERGWTVSVIARGHARLSDLARAAGLGAIPVPADYTDEQELAARLRATVSANGPVSLVVCWVHESTAPRAVGMIAGMVEGTRARPCRFVHVVGSAAADPSRERVGPWAAMEGIEYRRVVLGFVVEGGRSRWLTDEEICAGVLRAIGGDEAESVIGTVRPWGRRPA